MSSASDSGFDRLHAAIAAHHRFTANPGADPQAFLAEHEHLRDLLEPMLREVADDEPDGEIVEARVLGDFRLLGEIGRGGMGVVYEARQISLNRRVALKVLPPGFALSTQAIARFQRESRVAARLDHPGLARVLVADQEDDTYYYAMEFVEGAPLDRVMHSISDLSESKCTAVAVARAVGENSTAPPTSANGEWRGAASGSYLDTVVDFGWQIARALHYAHQAGIIHRDVKPSNVLIRGDGTAVLTDFGLAREEGLPSLTQTGDTVGTPYYISPEQIGGEREVDHRTDIYSLGVTLFELATRRRPFESKSIGDLKGRIRYQEPPRPRRWNSEISRDLQSVLLKCLEKDPDRRYSTAADLADDLRRLRDGESVRARPVSSLTRGWRWAQRNRRVALTIGALTLATATSVVLATQLGVQNAALQSERAQVAALTRVQALQVQLVHATSVSEESFYPAHQRSAAIEQWLVKFAPLRDQLPALRAELQALRDRAVHQDPTELHAWIGSRIGGDEYFRAVEARDSLREALRSGALIPAEAKAAEVELSALDDRVTTLEQKVGSRFADEEDQDAHDALVRLIENLEAFTEPKGLLARVQRAAQAHDLRQRTVYEHRDGWQRAIEAIASSPHYDGLRLVPQVGLLPLGPDPDSGLWEFAHLQSGSLPRRGTDGKLVLQDDFAMVFVLLPGGRFWMGAQSDKLTGHNYDPQARPDERPVHQVRLDPFFVAKYEMTKGQWMELAWDEDPSYHNLTRPPSGKYRDDPQPVSKCFPVESVSWDDCDRLLTRFALDMPTEAQWEYAARGGAETPWSTGSNVRSLIGAASLSDRSAVKAGKEWPTPEQWLDDGAVIYMAVDRLAANPFGLHFVHGNVGEWCDDDIADYTMRARDGDGLRQRDPRATRVVRGAGFNMTAVQARTANRGAIPRSMRAVTYGVRPIRRVE